MTRLRRGYGVAGTDLLKRCLMLNPRKQPFTPFYGDCGARFSKILEKFDAQIPNNRLIGSICVNRDKEKRGRTTDDADDTRLRARLRRGRRIGERPAHSNDSGIYGALRIFRMCCLAETICISPRRTRRNLRMITFCTREPRAAPAGAGLPLLPRSTAVPRA